MDRMTRKVEAPAAADVLDNCSSSIVSADPDQQPDASKDTRTAQQTRQPQKRTRKAGARRTSKFSSKEDRTKKRNREAQRRFRIAQKERHAGLLDELEQLRGLVSTLKAKNAALAARLNVINQNC